MKSKLFIPKKLKIGFQTRKGTFTGKLAYIIYYDEKGKLRKETSHNQWCDKKIPYIEVDNNPQDGFTLNKGVQRDGYWGNGRSLIRVYDPRDFEFEISIDNLVGVLMHSDCFKRELTEKFVYAWNGTDLILLPTNSVEYQESVEYTAKQSEKVSAKNLIKGATYSQKKHDELLTYVGYLEWYEYTSWYHQQNYKGKKHVFFDGKNFSVPTVTSVLASCVNDQCVDNYAEIVDKFYSCPNGQKIVDAKISPLTVSDSSLYRTLWRKQDDTTFESTSFHFCSGGIYSYGINRTSIYSYKKEPFEIEHIRDTYPYHRTDRSKLQQDFDTFVKKYPVNDSYYKVPLEDQIQFFKDQGFGNLTYVFENDKTFTKE